MDKLTLKKVIAALYDIELDNYLMRQTIDSLNHKISLLCIPQTVEKLQVEKPVVVRRVATAEKMKDMSEENYMYSVFICGVIGFIIGLISGDWLLEQLFGGAVGAFIGILAGVIVVPVISWIIRFIGDVESKSVANKENERYQMEYEEECRRANLSYKENVKSAEEDYKTRLHLEADRIKKETAEKEKLIVNRKALEYELKKSENVLAQMYDGIGMLEEYRSLIHMGYMNSLMRKDICASLGGERGLYEKTDDYLKRDQLYGAVNRIGDKLDTLIDQNNMLYNAIVQVNNNMGQLMRSIDEDIAIGYIPRVAEREFSNQKGVGHIGLSFQLEEFCAKRHDKEQEYLRILNLV